MARKRSRRKPTRSKSEDAPVQKTPDPQSSRKPASKTTRVVGALALIALSAAAIIALRSKNTESSLPSSREVFPVGVELPQTPRSESLFAAVDPNRDQWTSEAVNEELEARLAAIGTMISQGAALPENLSALSEYLGGLSAIDDVKFKVVAVDLDSKSAPVESARTRVVFELSGRGNDDALIARRSEGAISWQMADGGEWGIRTIELDPASEVTSIKALFTDATALAFADVESYRRQMALGINDYRGRLDAASGIDVFGHNGVSIVDANGDGLEDIFVAQPAGLPNRLYRNAGDGTFADVSAQAGIDVLDRTSMGLFADYDNDGDDDLALILQSAAPVLFTNDGRGAFTRSESLKRTDAARATYSSAAATDFDNDGLIDIYVCAYLVIDAPGADKELPLPYPYHDARNGAANVLFKNIGGGRFEDVTVSAGLDENNNRFSLAAAWRDYDSDGHSDLYVANDFGRNNLYRNLGNGRFEDVSDEASVEDLGAGMSVAWGDYDADGRDDLYVGNMWSSAGQRLTHQADYQRAELRSSFARHAKGNTLFRNQGDGSFEDVSDDAGVALGRWAWGTDFFDADNDGDEDIYVANGYITNRSDRDL